MQYRLRLGTLLALLGATAVGCSSAAAPTDVVVTDVVATDVGVDAPADATPLQCGAQTCGANQFCYQGCCGAAGCVPPVTCMDLPAACLGNRTCGCFYPSASTDAGGGVGCFCGGLTVTCTGCP